MPMYEAADLYGAETVEDSAKLFVRILSGEGTRAQNDVVCINAALAISCVKPELNTADALAAARESLESQKSLNLFTKLLSHDYA